MDREVSTAVRDLLSSNRVLALAIMLDDQPEATLLPFAPASNHRAVYVQASQLARHARALTDGARVGILVHANDTPAADPLQLARLMVQGMVRVLERDSDEFTAASERFIERFRGAAVTLSLGDFNLYELTLGNGRYVEGFARAFDVTTDTFNDIAAL